MTEVSRTSGPVEQRGVISDLVVPAVAGAVGTLAADGVKVAAGAVKAVVTKPKGKHAK